MFIKQFILGVAMLFTASAFAQQSQPAADVDSKDTNEQAQLLSMAGQLVKYGYQTKAALPLIQAVQIYKSLNVTEGTREKTSEGGAADSESIAKTDVVSFDEAKLLEDATKFAGSNKSLIALINDTKKASRGPVTGTVRHTDVVRAGATDVYNIRFRAGERATVIVSGDGDTDLDLYIYDENGNLITYDNDGLDDCLCRFTPRWTGNFKIKIKNLGRVYNRYVLLAY